MACQICGRHAPAFPVTLYQNIGMLVAFRHQKLDGVFCRDCIAHYFWEYTLVTLVLGWWSIISVFFTPMILINNLFYFIRAQMRQAAPSPYIAPLASNLLADACPRCQTLQSSRVGLSHSVLASLTVSGLFLAWAGYLVLGMAQGSTSIGNWVVAGFFVGLNFLVAICLLMLMRHPLRRCQQCHAIWSVTNP
ncbi:MAG: hypothetical protein EI684_10225 [Candidatus Viridilinea halotolerans]|uniref:Uncharacterized protein n=1 Tax=Candidatus Viridilinea halotolerans TaxID=2491704 RepID=A0A426U097_9CHLR|nr:MAG: hypothetical protein EI684_10225 [Candidatus Viridilinea halotolerans]